MCPICLSSLAVVVTSGVSTFGGTAGGIMMSRRKMTNLQKANSHPDNESEKTPDVTDDPRFRHGAGSVSDLKKAST
jgi:hypothetical protein